MLRIFISLQWRIYNRYRLNTQHNKRCAYARIEKNLNYHQINSELTVAKAKIASITITIIVAIAATLKLKIERMNAL